MDWDNQVDILRLIQRCVIYAIIEITKYIFGQSIGLTLKSMICGCLIATAIEGIENGFAGSFIFFVFILFNTAEAINWNFIGNPLNKQSLTCLDMTYITKDHPEFFFIGITLLIFLIIYIFIFPPFINLFYKISVDFSDSNKIINLLMTSLFFFLFLIEILRDFQGGFNQTIVGSKRSVMLEDRLYDLVMIKPSIIKYHKKNQNNNLNHKGKIPKNLILIQLESTEYQMITNVTMPYLYSIKEKYQAFAPIESTPYSTWSTSGTVLTQSGIPQIITNVRWNERHSENVKYLAKVPGISDYLARIGYSRFYGIVGSDNIQGFGQWREEKKYKIIYRVQSDRTLFNMLTNDFLKNTNKYLNGTKNFIGWFVNANTHRPYVPRKWCRPQNKQEPAWRQCFNCLDQVMKPFIETFLKKKMYEDTILAIYPDHLTFGSGIPPPHELFLILPGIEKNQSNQFVDNVSGSKLIINTNNTKYEGKERVYTYYDFAPTIMDLLGIKDYIPGFPFGNSMFSKEEGEHPKPTFEDYNIIFNFLQNTLHRPLKNRQTFKCIVGNRTVYSKKVCNNTAMP